MGCLALTAVLHFTIQANTRRRINVGLRLGQIRRRWPSTDQKLDQRLMLLLYP